jgi:MFS family permease
MTSLISIPRATFVALSARSASRLGSRHGERRVVVAAAAGLSLVMVTLALAAATTTLALVAICLAASGWLWGHITTSLVSTVRHAVDDGDFGLVTSLQQTANQVGSVIGIGLFTAIAADATTPGPFVTVYLVAAMCALGTALITGRLGAVQRMNVQEALGLQGSAQELQHEVDGVASAHMASASALPPMDQEGAVRTSCVDDSTTHAPLSGITYNAGAGCSRQYCNDGQ